MHVIRRRLIYATLFEGLAIVFTSVGLAQLSGSAPANATVAGFGSSVIALAWNLVYTTLYERWEARQPIKGRGFRRRAVHAVGFELGLMLMTVPLFAFVLGISWWEAVVYDIGLIVFFLVYTYVFNLGFDKVFGLPASALPHGEAS
ncbi:PACE efflux transporter [Ideonella sp. DXS29W]|uniref:PACE efflux transporter n=1 Tax=Ideonella lacteola TaxID=2984193 RepID=A0ABU9BTP4_9BURK